MCYLFHVKWTGKGSGTVSIDREVSNSAMTFYGEKTDIIRMLKLELECKVV